MSVAQLAGDLPFPVIADPDRKLALLLGLMNPEEKDAMLPLSCRPLVFIGPDKTVRAVILYPDFVGRNFHEILRVLDGLQVSTGLLPDGCIVTGAACSISAYL